MITMERRRRPTGDRLWHRQGCDRVETSRHVHILGQPLETRDDLKRTARMLRLLSDRQSMKMEKSNISMCRKEPIRCIHKGQDCNQHENLNSKKKRFSNYRESSRVETAVHACDDDLTDRASIQRGSRSAAHDSNGSITRLPADMTISNWSIRLITTNVIVFSVIRSHLVRDNLYVDSLSFASVHKVSVYLLFRIDLKES